MTLVLAYEQMIGGRGSEIKAGEPAPPTPDKPPVIASPPVPLPPEPPKVASAVATPVPLPKAAPPLPKSVIAVPEKPRYVRPVRHYVQRNWRRYRRH
jgi:hypothetical protein